MSGDRGEKGALDLPAGHIAGVKDAALRVSAFAAEIQLVRSVGKLALVKVDPALDQLPDARRPIGHDRPNDPFVAQAGAGFERILDVKLE